MPQVESAGSDGVQTLRVHKDLFIAATPDIVWESILAETGTEMRHGDGNVMSMKIEQWPGGRWFRDLGNNAGHLWGHVQVIKPPTLVEIQGPMMLSFPATNHIQYRLTAEGERTHLKLTYRGFGYFPKGFLDGMDEGWDYGLKRTDEIAQRMKKQRGGKR